MSILIILEKFEGGRKFSRGTLFLLFSRLQRGTRILCIIEIYTVLKLDVVLGY